MTVLFAILSAFLYAVANIYTKKGFEHTNTISAFIISVISCFVTSLVICIFLFPLDQFVNRAIWFFLAAGIIGPFLGRILLYEAIDRVGISLRGGIGREGFAVQSESSLGSFLVLLHLGGDGRRPRSAGPAA